MNMATKTLRPACLVVFLALVATALGGSDPATVSITATVDTYVEWADHSPAIAAGDWSGTVTGHVTGLNVTITATKALTLYSNANVTITPTTTLHSGILTNGTDTLTTSYKITGDVGTQDTSYKAAGSGSGEFFNASNTYTVTHVPGDGSYTVNLLPKAVSPADKAVNSGDYTCNVVLTASWS
jgi:hypothetical protein